MYEGWGKHRMEKDERNGGGRERGRREVGGRGKGRWEGGGRQGGGKEGWRETGEQKVWRLGEKEGVVSHTPSNVEKT